MIAFAIFAAIVSGARGSSATHNQRAALPLWPQPTLARASGPRRRVHPQLEIVRPDAMAANDVLMINDAILRYSGLLHQLKSRPGFATEASQHDSLLSRLQVTIQRPEEAQLDLLTDESYELRIVAGEPTAELIAPTAFGAMHGLESFLQLLSHNPGWIAATEVYIRDAPEYAWRGLMIDSGRRFWPVSVVKNTLDTMSAVKLNVLHLHASDHCRWAVESKLFPQLTSNLTGSFAGAEPPFLSLPHNVCPEPALFY